ncbi:hypothetical protein VTL71DRAFT_9608 [Oculimacula yallundae]|uniref:D-isomer specific 2-hydroxyacid dehydrogenase NAD-binding domain-containing protein n=1 Tax=Oculimacula yallundae TaxID=86028 RepID=A0ABR4BRF2_9HELO
MLKLLFAVTMAVARQIWPIAMCQLLATPLAAKEEYSDLSIFGKTFGILVAEVLAVANILTIHAPLTSTTRDLISYEELLIMKRDAILIRGARGEIAHGEDLKRALEECPI